MLAVFPRQTLLWPLPVDWAPECFGPISSFSIRSSWGQGAQLGKHLPSAPPFPFPYILWWGGQSWQMEI